MTYDPEAVDKKMLMAGKVPAQPRMRVETNATALTLSTAWQRVSFGDANTLNVNTFPMETASQRAVDWDSATGLFKFNASEDRNYNYCFYGKFETTNVLGVLTTQPIRVHYRFVVPNGKGAGSPLYFPFPADGTNAYGTFEMVNLTSETRISNGDIIYASQAIRANGVAFELRLSAAPVLGSVRLTLATALIYGR